jgi:hypothetical protein
MKGATGICTVATLIKTVVWFRVVTWLFLQAT